MSRFEPKEHDISSVNNGAKYSNGQGISADSFNALVETAFHAQSKAKSSFKILKSTDSPIKTKADFIAFCWAKGSLEDMTTAFTMSGLILQKPIGLRLYIETTSYSLLTPTGADGFKEFSIVDETGNKPLFCVYSEVFL